MLLKTKALLYCLPLLFLLSCGGGGGGAGDDGDGGDTGGGGGDPSPNDEILNPDLTGKFSLGAGAVMDAATGRTTKFPNSDYGDQTDLFGSDTYYQSFRVSAVRNSSSYLLTYSSGSSESQAHVLLQDIQGNYGYGQHLILNPELRVGRLSQDLQYVAVMNDFGLNASRYEFKIFGWDGTLHDKTEISRIKTIRWLNDNRLIHYEGRNIYINRPVSTEVEYTLTLPEPGSGLQAGVITGITLSPDDTQIAFTLGEYADGDYDGPIHSRLYIANLDYNGLSGIRLVATRWGDPVETYLNIPRWSPDGRWIFVIDGFKYSDFIDLGRGFDPEMYIVPTEDLGKVLYVHTIDEYRSPEVRRVWRRHIENHTSTITTKASGHIYEWMPD